MTDEIMKDIPFSTGEHLMYISPDNEPFMVDDKEFYQGSRKAGLLDQLTPEKNGRVTWSDEEQKYLVIYDISQKKAGSSLSRFRIQKSMPLRQRPAS